MAKPKIMLFAPNGLPIISVIAYTVSSASIDKVSDDGSISEWHHDDFPTFDIETDLGVTHVSDRDGNGWLSRHCRPVKCPDDFDMWDYAGGVGAWPADIIEACAKADGVAWALHNVGQLRSSLPLGYRDTTTEAVLDAVITKRLQEELDRHETAITAFRKGRTEVTVLPDEENEDA